MVASAPFALDIASEVVSVALPGLAWALLFVLAWRRPEFAESVGLGRRTFWLLLPGALASSLAVLPFVPVHQDVLGVSFSGAVFPLLVAGLAVGRMFPAGYRARGYLLAALGVQTVVLLVPVLLEASPSFDAWSNVLGLGRAGAVDALVALLAVVGGSVAVGIAERGNPRTARRLAVLFLGALAVTVLTFLGTQAIAGVGIVEGFPYFLLPPGIVGFVVGASAGSLFRGEEGFALPSAFFAGAVGTTIGADVLRQPGLYGPGPGGLYVIGGAGVLDLVYLSGFLALGGALLGYLLLGHSFRPVGPGEPAPLLGPAARLRAAYDLGVAGEPLGSLRASAQAADAAAAHARLLRRGADVPTDSGRPWEGLAVPGWVVADHANLRSAAQRGTSSPTEALRGWLTARWLVRWSAALGRERFASLGQRAIAYAIDLAILLAVSAAIFVAAAEAAGGSLDDLLGGVGYNAAIYACISGAYLYFVLFENGSGATPGKRWLGLEVRDRALRRPDGFAALLRNASLVPSLSLAILGVGVAVAFLVKGLGAVSVGGLAVPAGLFAVVGVLAFVAGGLALAGGVGVLAISLSFERQRVGDAWAGTWVVRRASAPVRSVPTAAPPASGRSG